MTVQTSPSPRHPRIVMLLHWLIALFAIVNWRLVEAAEHASKPDKQALMGNHFAIGIIIFILALVMIGCKVTHRSPPLANHLKAWEVALAKVVHLLFLILLIVLPVLGWVAMSSFGRGISMFGLFTWPALPVGANPDLAGTLFEIHSMLGKILVILLGLHVLGVLKHQFLDRDGNLYRMLPFGNPKA